MLDLWHRSRGKWRLATLVILACCATYFNSLNGDFIYDDRPIIVDNALVRGPLSPAKIFASPYWNRGDSVASRQGGGLYRPLTIFSFALNRRISEGKPFSFHFVNLVLHALAAMLLFQLLVRLGISENGAAFGALVFAVLPLHVEAVSWIVGRAEVLGTVFILSAWILLHQRNSRIPVITGLALYSAALMCKESSAPFPAAWIIGEIFLRRGSFKKLLHDRLIVWLCAFGVLLFYLSWRHSILGSAFVVGRPYFSGQPRLVVFLTMAKFLFKGWLVPMVTGLGLCADYARPGFPDASPTDPFAWSCLVAALGAAIAAGVAFYRRKSYAALSFWFFFTFAAPLLNILIPMEIIGAERIMYLPSLAFCLLMAVAWENLPRYLGRAIQARTFLAAICLAWWSFLTVQRNKIWASETTLFTATAQAAPTNPRVLSGLGILADRQGHHERAREFYRQALSIDPRYSQAAYNMGMSYFQDGAWREAQEWFKKPHDWPQDKDTLCFLGLIAERGGRDREALDYYFRALEIDSTQPVARRNLGLLLVKMGRLKEAQSLLNGPS